jgi:hypothetical protein
MFCFFLLLLLLLLLLLVLLLVLVLLLLVLLLLFLRLDLSLSLSVFSFAAFCCAPTSTQLVVCAAACKKIGPFPSRENSVGAEELCFVTRGSSLKLRCNMKWALLERLKQK